DPEYDLASRLYHFRYDLNFGHSSFKHERFTRQAIEQRRMLRNLLRQSRMLVSDHRSNQRSTAPQAPTGSKPKSISQ
ncbi:MAG: hypothetical protein WBD95_28505, partial [Xanthobacteraceae bacterium]